jgi:hypothetical protein
MFTFFPRKNPDASLIESKLDEILGAVQRLYPALQTIYAKEREIMASQQDLEAAIAKVQTDVQAEATAISAEKTSIDSAVAEIQKLAAGGTVPQAAVDALNSIAAGLETSSTNIAASTASLNAAVAAGG